MPANLTSQDTNCLFWYSVAIVSNYWPLPVTLTSQDTNCLYIYIFCCCCLKCLSFLYLEKTTNCLSKNTFRQNGICRFWISSSDNCDNKPLSKLAFACSFGKSGCSCLKFMFMSFLDLGQAIPLPSKNFYKAHLFCRFSISWYIWVCMSTCLHLIIFSSALQKRLKRKWGMMNLPWLLLFYTFLLPSYQKI